MIKDPAVTPWVFGPQIFVSFGFYNLAITHLMSHKVSDTLGNPSRNVSNEWFLSCCLGYDLGT